MRSIPYDVNDSDLRKRFLRSVLFEALEPLRGDTRAGWGNMTPLQMVEHLAWGFGISTGRVLVECHLPEAKRERAKQFLYDRRPMPHDFMNPALVDGLPPLRHPGLGEARATLREEVDRFLTQAPADPGPPHPIFGPLGLEEWERIHFKHCYHHLLQFGLIEEEGGDPALM